MENQLHSPIKNSKQTMIEGVKITNLKIMSDERGKVMHMLRSDSPVLKNLVRIIFLLFTRISLKDGTYILNRHLIMFV